MSTLVFGDEHEDTSEDDDKEDREEEEEQHEEVTIVVLLVDVFESKESFSLRQTEQTPGFCLCLGCFLQNIIDLDFDLLLLICI